MGHTRLGAVPKTRKWRDLVERISGLVLDKGAIPGPLTDVDQIASWTLDAAQKGLEKAVNDTGVQYTFFLLTQVALASRSSEWRATLHGLGIHLSEKGTIFDLLTEVQAAVDRQVPRGAPKGTDIGEMAQQAAGEAISSLAGPRAETLFGTSPEDVQNAIRHFSTKKGFGELGQRFFGGFVARFLNFYLSRITAGALGGARFQQLGDVAEFNEALRAHCDQSARIVRDFSGEWYSKTEYLEGIDRDNCNRFIAVAIQKLRSELERQKAEQ